MKIEKRKIRSSMRRWRKIKYHIKDRLDEYPKVYKFIYNNILRGNSNGLSLLDDLVVEGFPSSGNTYLTHSISMHLGESLSIAHHMHSTSLVKIALKKEIPVILCVRDPIDTAVSNAVRQKTSYFEEIISASDWLKYWVRFHNRILEDLNSDYLYISEFSNLTNDVASEILKFKNQYFHRANFLYGNFEREIFAVIKREEELEKGDVFKGAALPSAQKNYEKKILKQELTENESALTHQARDLYSTIVERSQ